MTAAAFVRAALAEVGQSRMAPFIVDNRAGHPAFNWHEMDDYPTRVEVDAVIQAFDLWYQRHLERHWRGRRPGDVNEWLELMYVTKGW